jgi:hypothetical protein
MNVVQNRLLGDFSLFVNVAVTAFMESLPLHGLMISDEAPPLLPKGFGINSYKN